METGTLIWLVIIVTMLVVFAFLTYKIVSNLHSRTWKSVFWGSWILDASQLNAEGQRYRRLYFACLAVFLILLILLLASALLPARA